MARGGAKAEETATAERRKAQVLEAAAKCFRQKGFHGSSMAQISEAAGMSSGHIYHYFKNKDEIIGAIVDREKDEVEFLLDGMKNAANPEDAMRVFIDTVEQGVAMHQDTTHASLKMEILAEAGRNPDIASRVQRNNAELKNSHLKLFNDSDASTASRLELAAALMEGVSIRTLRNPNLDKELDVERLKDIIRYIFSAP